MPRAGCSLLVAAVLGVTAPEIARSQPASDREPVRIGVLEDMSGPLSGIGGPGNVIAARMAVEDFGGSVLGRRIDVLSADDQNKPDVGLATVRRWFDLDNVTMVTGLGNSAVALAVQNLARERKRINIVAGAATTELTGKSCSPTGFQWNWDTHAFASTVVNGMMASNEARSWYFVTVDYAFGHSMERDATTMIQNRGGALAGSSRHPLGTVDYASFLLQAQTSKAQVIGLASVSSDLINVIKASAEFGIVAAGQKLAAFILHQQDVNDFVNKDARIRADGRLLRKLFLVQVKSPAEETFPGDYFKMLATIDPEVAFGKMNDNCALAKTAN